MFQTIIAFAIVIIAVLFIIFSIIKTIVKIKKGYICSCCSKSNNCNYRKNIK